MIFVIGASITAAAVAAATACGIWMSRMRPVDRVCFTAEILTRTGLQRVLERADLCNVKVSNGSQILLPHSMKETPEEILKLKIRSDDVIVATYSKAGTTWMQEIVWLVCNNANTKEAKNTRLVDRFGFVDLPQFSGAGIGLQGLENWPNDKRRFVKTHMPIEFLPNELQRAPKGKMICVARNPKDNCVSLYHFQLMNMMFPNPGPWDQFLVDFCEGSVQLGSWFDHVHGYWQLYQQHKDNVYFVTFEALKKDLKGEVTKIARFLEEELSEDQIDAITQHCSFSSMSKNKSTNYSDAADAGVFKFNVSKFMRKGEVGDWKNHFTINQNKAFDELYAERTKDWTLKFEFEAAE